jgi:hypothetical protein
MLAQASALNGKELLAWISSEKGQALRVNISSRVFQQTIRDHSCSFAVKKRVESVIIRLPFVAGEGGRDPRRKGSDFTELSILV